MKDQNANPISFYKNSMARRTVAVKNPHLSVFRGPTTAALERFCSSTCCLDLLAKGLTHCWILSLDLQMLLSNKPTHPLWRTVALT